jgi:hypothetical protein
MRAWHGSSQVIGSDHNLLAAIPSVSSAAQIHASRLLDIRLDDAFMMRVSTMPTRCYRLVKLPRDLQLRGEGPFQRTPHTFGHGLVLAVGSSINSWRG